MNSIGISLAVGLSAVLFGAAGLAQQVNVTGLAFEPLELFASTSIDADPVGEAAAGDFNFPTPVTGISRNGMLKVRVKGRDYWVIADDVETDQTIDIDVVCEPETKGATVAFGARGLGEGCE